MGLLSIEHEQVFHTLSKNNNRDLTRLTSGSGLELLWTCDKNHEYLARVFNRVKGSGCPYCSGLKPIVGINDLATTHPQIIPFWDDQDILPHTVSAGSNKKIWLKCSLGHRQLRKIKESLFGIQRCSQCSLISTAENSLNESLLTQELLPGQEEWYFLPVSSPKILEWVCDLGHVYSSSVKNRNYGRGCPTCAGRTSLNLKESHPTLCQEWGDNNDCLPEDFTYGSSKKVWWKCVQGHSFYRSICDRAIPGLNSYKMCVICSHEIIIPGTNDLATTHPQVASLLVNPEMSQRYSYGSESIHEWKCSQGHQWKTPIRYLTVAGSGCPICAAASQSSKAELEIKKFLEEQGIKVLKSQRSLLPNSRLEIDLYLPDYNFAIEYNGLYWHSEAAGKKKDYHAIKAELCKQAGITLYQIWEDDWHNKKEIVKRAILHRLGLSKQKTYPARKCRVISVTNDQAHEFLQDNHIQGSVAGSKFWGLEDARSSMLVAVIAISCRNNVGYLQRYATSAKVPGGFSKIINTVWKYLPQEIDYFYTFSDNSLSQGDLYSRNEWIRDKILPPDYSYFYKNKRQHKFGFRLARFREDDDLQYIEGLTERELAVLNKIPRIWDSGKIRWKLDRPMK